MQNKQVNKLLLALQKDYFLFAPQKMGENLRPGQEHGIKEVKDLSDIDWTVMTPYGSWKSLLLPASERLFNFSDSRITEDNKKYPPIACVGVSHVDLKAFTLYEMVFTNDLYYQKRRQNMLIIGYYSGLPDEYKKYRVYSSEYKEDILEHIVFDIFIATKKNGALKFYTGSEKGQMTLEKNGITDYQHIEFAGPISEKGQDKRMLEIMAKMEKSYSKKIWDELDKRCIACGKCTIACPTCFCFDLEDKDDPDNKCRNRKWGVCFYNDFSKVAGGQKELDTVKKKIYFWYYHKFVRIPKEYGIPGCVGCSRCSRACPVDIFINETINAL